jgi:hypothetical protein
MVVDKINKKSAINGQRIQVVIGDTETDPAKTATIVKKFIHSDKVAAIIGPTFTGEGMNAKKIVEEAGVSTFMTVGGAPPHHAADPLKNLNQNPIFVSEYAIILFCQGGKGLGKIIIYLPRATKKSGSRLGNVWATPVPKQLLFYSVFT